MMSAWEVLWSRGLVVPWLWLFWFGGKFTRHAFITWLAVRDRLGTRDWLHQLYLSLPTSYSFCDSRVKWTDHLFFDCQFGREVWRDLLC